MVVSFEGGCNFGMDGFDAAPTELFAFYKIVFHISVGDHHSKDRDFPFFREKEGDEKF